MWYIILLKKFKHRKYGKWEITLRTSTFLWSYWNHSEFRIVVFRINLLDIWPCNVLLNCVSFIQFSGIILTVFWATLLLPFSSIPRWFVRRIHLAFTPGNHVCCSSSYASFAVLLAHKCVQRLIIYQCDYTMLYILQIFFTGCDKIYTIYTCTLEIKMLTFTSCCFHWLLIVEAPVKVGDLIGGQ